jgi:tRNA-dihydrouridine synthase B
LKLGGIRIDNPFVQAPMAGVTGAPFRTLARRFHKGLLFTEMVSAEALCRNNKRTLNFCRIQEEHHPVALQLVGHDADRVAEAAKKAEAFGPDIIDINAGCPDNDIVRQGAGGALLKDPAKLVAIVEKVVKAVKVPVSVKLRLGFDTDISQELGRLLDDAGAAFLTFNGYLVTQKFSGHSDWPALKDLVDVLSIPVIANGGVKNEEDAVELLTRSGAEGVMIGRASRGRPDIPGTALSLYQDGKFERMDENRLRETIVDHAKMECALLDEDYGMRRMRKHLHWYFKAAGLKYDAGSVDEISSLTALERLLDTALCSHR